MQRLVSAHTTDPMGCLAELAIGIKYLVHFKRRLFLPADSSSTCPVVFLGVFFASWHLCLAHLALGVRVCTYMIPAGTSPNVGLCLTHSWLKHLCCNTLRGDWCLWKWQWQLCPPMWHLWGVVVVLSMPSASDTWQCPSAGAEAALSLNACKFLPTRSCF